MRVIPVETQSLIFIHLGAVEPALGQDEKQRTSKEGVLLWKVPVAVVASDTKVPEGSVVTVPSATAPKLDQGAEVKFRSLRARQWSIGTSNGISLSAESVEIARPKAS